MTAIYFKWRIRKWCLFCRNMPILVDIWFQHVLTVIHRLQEEGEVDEEEEHKEEEEEQKEEQRPRR